MAKITRSSTQYAVRIQAFGKNLKEGQRKAVGDAALVVKRSIERQTAIATKGSMGFSRMDRKKTRSGRYVPGNENSSKLRVGYDIKGEFRPTALLVARGPWGLIEYGSVPHEITSRMDRIRGSGATRRRRQRQLDLAFRAVGAFSGVQPLGGGSGGGKPVFRVNHPGTQGKKPFSRGVDLARADATRKVRGTLANVIADTIRVNGRAITYIRGEVGGYQAGE